MNNALFEEFLSEFKEYRNINDLILYQGILGLLFAFESWLKIEGHINKEE